MVEATASRRISPLLAGAFAISFAVHAALLSLQFRMPEATPAKDRGLEVVLVNARHANAPEKADVLAQANVDGGGTSEQAARPTSPLPPQAKQRDGDALAEAKQRTQEPVREQKQVITREKSPAKVAAAPATVEQPAPAPEISGLDLLDSAAAVARLEAEIDRKLDEIAKRPRKVFIGAKAREYRFAQYVEDWRLKVERVGTLNYPEAARGRLYGSLRLSVSIRADGTVAQVDVGRSSGHKLLDEAAVRIVQMAAPYAPFPPDIRRDTDIIEITRTWTFTNTNQVRAN
ncbi:energy transducer TonB [Thauera linaloolentis]|uniref:TonB family protein n=1 Tax=Thauera linaloolentis (strain DSM 12138 / JCM 21573 / CCUG 41526 / CIP 105981 / IAM 15112 / NBRC 102519 / 47Lol) TaxID=1123367 RepID=N6ZB76_THAL4|nr:energy transducer TonB [Thauera linaloolentis]ENO89419.1 TonB family protein [Thauera linaloolentis 47Lol = DSM 12138]MCM8564357.1 energy transducer TonB [Thauera linaloolentis]